jgi:hypothetical protein
MLTAKLRTYMTRVPEMLRHRSRPTRPSPGTKCSSPKSLVASLPARPAFACNSDWAGVSKLYFVDKKQVILRYLIPHQ